MAELQEELQRMKDQQIPESGSSRRPGIGRAIQTSPGLLASVSDLQRGTAPPRHSFGSDLRIDQCLKTIQQMDNKITEMVGSLEDLRQGAGFYESKSDLLTRAARNNRNANVFASSPDPVFRASSEARIGPRIVENIQLVPPREGRRAPGGSREYGDESGSHPRW